MPVNVPYPNITRDELRVFSDDLFGNSVLFCMQTHCGFNEEQVFDDLFLLTVFHAGTVTHMEAVMRLRNYHSIYMRTLKELYPHANS